MKVKVLVPQSCLVTPWTIARQAPLSMGFSRQEYRSGISFSRGSSLTRIEPRSPALQADSLPSEIIIRKGPPSDMVREG